MTTKTVQVEPKIGVPYHERMRIERTFTGDDVGRDVFAERPPRLDAQELVQELVEYGQAWRMAKAARAEIAEVSPQIPPLRAAVKEAAAPIAAARKAAKAHEAEAEKLKVLGRWRDAEAEMERRTQALAPVAKAESQIASIRRELDPLEERLAYAKLNLEVAEERLAQGPPRLLTLLDEAKEAVSERK